MASGILHAHSALAPSDLISISKACSILGVHPNSLRSMNWENEVKCYRVGPASHRRYSRAEILSYAFGDSESVPADKVLIYGRVSTAPQAKNNKEGQSQLSRQLLRLREYAKANYAGTEIEEWSDTCSSMNWSRPQLSKMLSAIMSGQYDGSVLLIEFADRLGRHARSICELIFQHHKIQIVYVEQEDATSESDLSSELLSLVHLYSIRMYARRSSERRRKLISERTVRRGKELLDAGLSIRATVERLNKEKHSCEDGSPISKRVVRQCIYLPSAKLEPVMPKAGVNSAQEYILEFAERADDNFRLPMARAYEHYAQWCKSSRARLIVDKRRFSAIFAKHFRKSIYEGQVCLQGVQIKAAKLHTVIRTFNRDLGFNSPTDLLRAFLESYRGRRISSKELWGAYCSFCKTRKLDSLKRTTFGRCLVQLGVQKFMGTTGWSYSLENYSG